MSKKLIETRKIKQEAPRIKNYSGLPATPGISVGETEPTVIDLDEFQYAYNCKHCGHERLEKHEEEDKES